MKRIHEFDGLRTLAVMIVIADHYAPFRNFVNGAPARLGGFGVDVFFVLSGYLITTILLRLRTTHRRYQIFYAGRFLRILPPYFLLLLIVYVIGGFLHEPFSKSKLIGQIVFLRSFKNSGVLFANVWSALRGSTAVPGLFHKLVNAPLPRDFPWLPMSASLGPTWSLSVEEWFYVLWAPVVLICRRRIIIVIAASICVIGFILRWLGNGGTDFFSSIDILIAGAVLALWIEQRPTWTPKLDRSVRRAVGLSSSLAFVLWIILVTLHRDLISRTLIEIFVFGALAWIVDNAAGPNPICASLRFKPLTYLGTISYMIYLIHLPMYFVIRSMLWTFAPGWPEAFRAWIIALGSVTAAVAFSALSWKYYECPILSLRKALTSRITSSVRRQSASEPLFPQMRDALESGN